MKHGGMIVAAALGLAMAVALPVIGRASDKDKDNKAPQSATVEFAMVQPQPAAAGTPGTPDNSSTHFLTPDDVTVAKGGSVTFVVNGGGHGIAIHPVSKNTTRAGIAAQLCNLGGFTDAQRRERNATCNGTILSPLVDVNGVSTNITGTDNLNYEIVDGKGNTIIVTGFNLTATNSNPSTIISNPRVDDAVHTHRFLATSGQAPAGDTNPATTIANKTGAAVAGTAVTNAPGNRIQVRFDKGGRYLVICMNRSHALNDHMFGFVNVVGDGDDDN
jgi:plastocyanin